MRGAKFIGVALVVLFAGCVMSTAEEQEAEEGDADVAASEAAVGEPRTDAKAVCLFLKYASQRAKEAFCRSQWRLDSVKRRACWEVANSGSPARWEVYCLITVFPG
ncbi:MULTISPECIES: hypothetical protein [Sorangium]|uniref:Secreted protein n=1 Tax=Sorangium cellulosum TaxID=56 RepID=A0A4P2QXZ6_SORCE|nr:MULTISPECIES: hypothetical protein [Sorangium]AUX35447.1 uncharacterized protein SOCE836_076390 [Sorangium cellulosum]WCQ94751.1 hypothetical protein NQZ70_07520 [Sorangium sp. Soce836]